MRTRTWRFSFLVPGLIASGLAAASSAPPALGQADVPIVLVANNVSDSVTTFSYDAGGALTIIGAFPTGDGPQTLSLSPDGRWLGVGHGTSSTTMEEFRIYEVNADGTLTHLETTLVPDSPLDCEWVDDEYIAIADTGGSSNLIQIYRWDDDTTTLSLVDSAVTGTFTAYFARHPTERIVYADDSGSARTISAWSVDSAGMLENIEFQGTGPVFALDMIVSNDGTKLYSGCGISDDGNRVLGYHVEGDGSLTPMAGSPFFSPGESPAHVVTTGDDTFLIVGHGTDATFRSFTIDDSTGEITPTGFLFDVGLQGTLGDLGIDGNLLFVTDESSSIDDITGLYSFTINGDGSFTQNGKISDTNGTRPETIEVWPGPPSESEPATLTDVSVTFGTLIAGTLEDLLESDDSNVQARSRLGFVSTQTQQIDVRVAAVTSILNGAVLDISVEGRISQPGGTGAFRLRNWSTNSFDQVHTYAIGSTEIVETINNVPAANRIRQSDGRIELQIRQQAVAVFSASFDSFTDHVVIAVK